MARSLVLILSLTPFIILAASQDDDGGGNSSFSAIFFFGDSTLDTGNNNFIPTFVRSNFLPYGRDFPGHSASGRFSNGRLVSDLLSSELGLKDYSPPFLDPRLSNDDLRSGVNFASAGSGYEEATSLSSNTMPISRQLEHFEAYITRLKGVVGEEEASRIVSNALVVISSGNNDVGWNFYLDPLGRGAFQYLLLGKVQGFLKNLYDLGARRFGVFGLLPIGCVPSQTAVRHPVSRACVEDQNLYCASYNSKLQDLLAKMQQSLPGSKVAYLNWYDPLLDMVINPAKYGFEETKRGCCGTGSFETGGFCNVLTRTCPDASTYVFFDAVHPSESAYRIITKQIMDQAIPQLT